jgi:hypothetical protein
VLATNVNFGGKLATSYVPLNIFTVVDWSAQLTSNGYDGFVTNMLPPSNPVAVGAGWNAQFAGTSWVTFDHASGVIVVAQFVFACLGDGVHDPINFTIQTSPNSVGSWTTVSTTPSVGTGGISTKQVFTLSSPVTARYWKFTITATDSVYQSYVTYFNFNIVPGTH